MPPPWSFISFPDLFNFDVADISAGQDADIAAVFDDDYGRRLVQAPGWVPEGDNYMTPQLAAALLHQMRGMVASAGGEPKALLIAGDLLGGHWVDDRARFEALFGTEGGTMADAVQTASAVMYVWLRELAAQGGVETVIAALGDHDIGDNPWRPDTDKACLVNEMKRAFGQGMVAPLDLPDTWNDLPSRAPEGDGAYDEATFVHQVENVAFVTLDLFRFEAPDTELCPFGGAVLADSTPRMLDWLGRVLDAAEADPDIDHVVVQAHPPILWPVNARLSSHLRLSGGTESDLWQLLRTHGTDAGGKVRAYIAGEVHATTVLQDEPSGILQITHGSLPVCCDDTYYMTFKVHEDRLVAWEWKIDTAVGEGDDCVWRFGVHADCPEETGQPARDVVLGPPERVGALTLDVGEGAAELSASGSLSNVTFRSGFSVRVGSDGPDFHEGHLGDTRMWGRAGPDTLRGGDGDDRIFGEAGDDDLAGQTGADRLFGGPGDDTLRGGSGDDTLRGGSGADTVDGADGADMLYGGDDRDSVIGGAGDDTLLGLGAADTLLGAGDADLAHGWAGDDLIRGGWGFDRLIGHAGADAIGGGTGTDWLQGWEGHDSLWGADGNDWLRGGPGADLLVGGPGDDLLFGGAEADLFVFDGPWSRDRVQDFDPREDVLLLAVAGEATDLAGFVDATAQVGADLVYDRGADGVNVIVLQTLTMADLSGASLVSL